MRITYEPFPRLSTLPVDDQEALEVVQDEWKYVHAGRITENAGRCVVVAAHNVRRDVSVLGHFSDVSMDLQAFPEDREGRRRFDEALTALERMGSRSRTPIWLGGAALHEPGGPSPEEMFAERAYVEGRFREAGFTNLTADWTEAPYNVVHVRMQPGGLLTAEFATFPYGPDPAA